jgi:alpha-glucosidase
MWELGFNQSRWGYTEADFRRLMQEFRQRCLPCDALYFDIDYMHGYRCFTWDQAGFSRLPELIDDLGKHGFKAVAILDPGIKIDPGYKTYESGTREDIFLKYPDGSRVSAPVWPGPSHFPDFTNPRARSWWGDQLGALSEVGFSGIWNDMNEPALISLRAENTLPDYVVHDWEGKGQTHVGGGHNVYGMLMARSTREGLDKLRPGKRQFVITRAAHAGAQRYTSSWTGDNVSTWDHLRLSISMVLNMGLSGMPFTGPDVGGFGGDCEPELFTRWMQLGSMLPFFRVHTSAGTAPQEPWVYGEPYESIIRKYLEQRYQLLPYIYSIFAHCTQEGMPIIRPVFMTDPTDENLRGIDNEFMLGDSLLVAPVLEPGLIKRQVYLPRGVWYEYDTGRLIDGAQDITADAPLDRMPVYVRAGKVLPMWPVRQYVDEKPLEEGRLRAYAGSGDTTIYEDAGEGLTYKNGDYRWSYFTCKFLPSGQFAIDWSLAVKYQPPYANVRLEVVGISGEPERVELDGQAAPVWYYESGIVEFSVRPFSEARIIGRSYTNSPAHITQPHPPE